MRHFATKLPFLLAASATIVSGQDATVTGIGAANTGNVNKCAAQKVVDQCVFTMKFQLENCATYDWDCLCTSSTNVVGCYNNCPESPDRLGAEQIRQQNCANAKAYDTTSVSPPATKSAVMSSSRASASTTDTAYSGLEANNNDDAQPTKSLVGLEASATASEGAAAAKAAGGWLAFLGLALGVMF
ncbi:hypothetical protein N7462_004086 [Penicillium macrosclerotiorum]|uniref:uncharacterized protein n=1 Tax=Penicillium macrosclerotiorum TaxID=303699 RepID=UPI002548C7B9|nr:uncharacterized protein N7462_004086 [Penicillium macrosclerotiorum]KAJ5689694.1 hypothetical protein N7462_004086 [Penicillium macrosclerotiorum]